jgi:hypothetical protein
MRFQAAEKPAFACCTKCALQRTTHLEIGIHNQRMVVRKAMQLADV